MLHIKCCLLAPLDCTVQFSMNSAVHTVQYIRFTTTLHYKQNSNFSTVLYCSGYTEKYVQCCMYCTVLYSLCNEILLSSPAQHMLMLSMCDKTSFASLCRLLSRINCGVLHINPCMLVTLRQPVLFPCRVLRVLPPKPTVVRAWSHIFGPTRIQEVALLILLWRNWHRLPPGLLWFKQSRRHQESVPSLSEFLCHLFILAELPEKQVTIGR